MKRDTLPGTPPLIRAVNRLRILDHVRRLGEVSRAELAKVTAIRPPTVSAVIRQLIDEGLVEETGNGEPYAGTGRPPRMVALRRRKAMVEHPFGTLKGRMDGGRFLLRGLQKVKAEMALAVTAYNLTRAINVLGTRRLCQALAT